MKLTTVIPALIWLSLVVANQRDRCSKLSTPEGVAAAITGAINAQLNFFIEPYWTKVVLEFPDREITVPLSDLLARHHAICCRSKETRDLFLFGQKIQTKPAFCPSLNYSRTDVLSMESILEKQTGDSKITATPRFYSHREIISNGRTWYLNVLFRKYIKFCCRHH